MELKQYLRPFLPYWKLSTAISLLVSLAVGIYLYRLGPYYKAQGLLFVESATPQETIDKFTYGGYYSQQKSANFSDNLPKLIKSFSMLTKAYNSINVNADYKMLKVSEQKVGVKKLGPQIIFLEVNQNKKDQAEILWNALSDVSIKTVNEISTASDQNYFLGKINPSPIITQQSRYPFIIGIAVFIFSLTSLYLTALLKKYMDN